MSAAPAAVSPTTARKLTGAAVSASDASKPSRKRQPTLHMFSTEVGPWAQDSAARSCGGSRLPSPVTVPRGSRPPSPVTMLARA